MLTTILIGAAQLALGLFLFFILVMLAGGLRDLLKGALTKWVRGCAAAEYHSQRWYERERARAQGGVQ